MSPTRPTTTDNRARFYHKWNTAKLDLLQSETIKQARQREQFLKGLKRPKAASMNIA